MSEPIDVLILQASRDLAFLGFALRNDSDATIAAALDIPLDRVASLRLCLAPRPGDSYAADLVEIAIHVRTSVSRLQQLLSSPQP